MQKLHIKTVENSLGRYIKHQEGPLLVTVRNNKTISTNGVVTPAIYKKNERCRIYSSWKNKIIHGQYLRDLDGKDSVQSWTVI